MPQRYSFVHITFIIGKENMSTIGNSRQMCTRKRQTEARPSSQDLKYSTAHRKSVQKQNYPKNRASFINCVVWSGDSHHIEYRAPLTFTNE